MTFKWGSAAVALAVAAAWSAASAGETVAGRIVRLDPALDALVGAEARLERIAEGFHWVEGPAWSRAGRQLVFSDIPANAIFRWREGLGVDLFLRPSGYSGTRPFAGREPGSNGLVFDARGRLVICEHGDRRITRLERDGRRTVLADRFEGKRLNSPNDAVYRSNGDLYFTDPPFGLPKAFDDPDKELPFSGVYRLDGSGTLAAVIRGVRAPNGIAFSPDERTLYVTDVDPARPAWLAYDVAADGSIANGRVLLDATDLGRRRKGGPDGLKVDRLGNLFSAGPEGVYVIRPDGRLLGVIETAVPTSNVAWGEDCRTLFVTADRSVYRIRLKTRGARCT